MDLQENIYKQVKKTYYMSVGFAGRHAVVFAHFSVDVFRKYIVYNYRLYCLWASFMVLTFKFARKSAEKPFSNILA